MGNWNCCPCETDDGGLYKYPEVTRPPSRSKGRAGARESLLKLPVTRVPLPAVRVEPTTLEVSRITSQEKNPNITTRKTAYTTWKKSNENEDSSSNKLWQVVTFTDELAKALFSKDELWDRIINDADKGVLQGGDAVIWEVSKITYRGLSIPPRDMLDSTFQIPFNEDVEKLLVVSLIVKDKDSQLWRYTINNGWKTFLSRRAENNNQTVDKVQTVNVLVDGETVTRYHVVPDNGPSTSGVPVKQKNMPAITSIRF